MVSSDGTVLGDPTVTTHNHHHGGSTNDDDDDDDDDAIAAAKVAHTAAVDLGLSLFGTSRSYRDQVEEEFDEGLRAVEEELRDICSGLDDAGGAPEEEEQEGAVEYFESISEGDDDDDDDDEGGMEDADSLRAHVAFLQLCARARRSLEDVDALSLRTDFFASAGTTTTTKTSTSSFHSSHYSPSSICGSPAEFGRYAFDDDEEGTEDSMIDATTADPTSPSSSSPMVRAARSVRRAEEALDGAAAAVENEHGGRSRLGGGHDGHPPPETKMERMRSCMLVELRHEARRRRSELTHRADAMFEGCIVVDAEAEGGSSTSLSIRGTSNAKAKETMARLGESSPVASTPRNDGGNVAPCPLSDAYQVMEILSPDICDNDARGIVGGTLDGAMGRLSRKLMDDVLRPRLVELEGQLLQPCEDGNAVVGYYKLTRDVSSSSSGGRVNGGRDRRRDCNSAIAVGGPSARLTWSLMRTTLAYDDIEGGGAAAAGTSVGIAAATGIDDAALRAMLSSVPIPPSSSSTNVATFLSVLNFASNLLSFVYEHALLGRRDLATMLGRHLFGAPSPASSPPMVVSGSAVMCGGLVTVGAAAHEETGEGGTAALMTALVGSMRRLLCSIPSGGDEEEEESGPSSSHGKNLWSTLRGIEGLVSGEVASFEGRMADMGFMMMTGEARAHVSGSPAAMSSSPSGLSVLVGSPIDPSDDDGTPSNLSAIDSPFPRPHAAETTNPNILPSPMSRLAASLRRAYAEERRSRILVRGRSILLDSAHDHHVTAEVGTLVPEPAEPGTPASLDDDPLAAFALPRCSVSMAARRILELVRSTLDDAATAEDDDDECGDGSGDRALLLAPTLYRASRELLDLFRSIVPATRAGEAGTVPRAAAVLHNDCEYLAHECSLLGAEYKSKFRRLDSDGQHSENGTKSGMRLLGECCSFLDMVPPFRDLAVKSMGSMIELQKGQLYELISPRIANFQHALGSNESVVEWDDADTALRAALYHLRHLSQVWRPVLSRGVYRMSMGNLIDLALTLFLDPVLKAEAITEPASRFVHSLFLDAARGAAEMFVVGTTDSAAGAESARGMPPADETSNDDDTMGRRFEVATKYAALFDRCQAVGRFMCMRLDEIRRGLEEGVFRSVTARELSHLISAAFDDSDMRRALLNDLANRH